MTAPNPSTALARVVVDQLVSQGVRVVAISPGSRSAALAIAASGHPDIDSVVFLDERSAAFYALGHAKASGRPAVVIATSGTAPANWFPATIEADASCTPLILISADRPARLRGVGANQTIDQIEMFGARVRLFADLAAPDHEDRVGEWKRLVLDAVGAARGEGGSVRRPGPVHLNISFEEPTVPVSDDGRSKTTPYLHPLDVPPEAGRTDPDRPDSVIPDLEPSGRGLVIAGDGLYDRPGLLRAANALGWPVLATALSGMRGTGVIGTYGHLLRFPLGHRPDVVIAVGATGPDERLDWLVGEADHGFRVDHWGRYIDPALVGATQLAADPVKLLESHASGARPDPEWALRWSVAELRVRTALDEYLGNSSVPTGARVAWMLNRVEREVLVVGSSLPIREVDAHLNSVGPVVANRGVSGIDGFVSTALGVSSASRRVVAFAGDLSLFHDSNGWLNDRSHDLTMVVVNNGGGGLFDQLPQRIHAPEFERLFIAAPDRQISDLARLHRIDHHLVTDIEMLPGLIDSASSSGGRHLIEVPVDREADLASGRDLDAAARAALDI